MTVQTELQKFKVELFEVKNDEFILYLYINFFLICLQLKMIGN